MKKIAYFITTILTLGGIVCSYSVLPAFAADSLGGQKVVTEVTNLQNKQNITGTPGKNSGNELQNSISKADTLIMNRLNSLNALLTRVQGDSKLTSTEKSSITTEIQKDISGLTALKAKIDADTTVAAVRTDAKSIITKYYVYSVFEPKTRLLVTLNNLQTTASYVQALVPQIQNLINTLKSQGKDTSKIQPLLDDISSQLKTINTTIASDITSVQNISTTTKRNSQDFSKVRKDITQIVRSGFAKIRSDFAHMRPLFKDLLGTTNLTPTVAPSGVQPTTTATETPSTSPAPTQ